MDADDPLAGNMRAGGLYASLIVVGFLLTIWCLPWVIGLAVYFGS